MAVVPLSDSSRTPTRLALVTILIVGANAVCFVFELAHVGGVMFSAVFGRLFEKPRRIFQ